MNSPDLPKGEKDVKNKIQNTQVKNLLIKAIIVTLTSFNNRGKFITFALPIRRKFFNLER